MSKNKARQGKVKVLIAAAVIVLAGLGAYLLVSNRQHPKVTTLSPVIHQLSTQNTSPNTAKNPSSSNGVSQGTSTNSSSPSSTQISTSENQWTTSQSGLITVKEPLNNQTVSSGFTLAGTSTVNNVQYTLIDNDVGVVSQGALNVANGTFSSTINFKPYGTSARLDVYSTQTDGAEENLVEITVNY